MPEAETTTISSRQILDELISSQIKLSSVYNECCVSCTDRTLREDFVNLARENSGLFSDELDEAQKRGWVSQLPADSDEIETLRAKYMPSK